MQDRQSDKSRCTDLFMKNYPRFYNYALREIRFRMYQGFAKPGDIKVGEVLDDALVRVADRLVVPCSDQYMLRYFYDEIKKAIEMQLVPVASAWYELKK